MPTLHTISATNIVTCLILAMAVAAAAMTITKTAIFRPMRSWVSQRSSWFGKLLSCPYCTSHWLVFFSVAWYQPLLVTSRLRVMDWFITCLAVVAVSSIFCGLIFYAFANMGGDDDHEE